MTLKTEDLLHQVLQMQDGISDRRDILVDVTAFYGRLTDAQRQRIMANFIILLQQQDPETSCKVMMRFAEFIKDSEVPYDPLRMGILIGQFIMEDKK